MQRKNYVVLIIAMFALASFISRGNEVAANEDNALAIVQDADANAVVVIADDADAFMQESADILVDYVEQSTNAELPIITLNEVTEGSDKVLIYIGSDGYEDELQNLDGDGFLIHPREDHLTIVGPTELGTRNGVYDFLERYVGVRWLMPGEAWTDVPQSSTILIPKEDIQEEPDFQFRSMNLGGDGDDHKRVRNEWKVKNRIQSPQQLQLGHNLYSLFPVEKYGETHPEFYPNGQPPAPGVTAGWQPCFTEEGTIDAAVSGIIEYFDNNPNATSFSLAVNDSGGYCEDDPSHPDYPDKINSVGVQDLSDIYYAWINEVVEQVLEIHPDKWFGLYAYQQAMDPPSFDVHPRAVPVITKDRLAWIDEDVRDGGHEHLDEWSEVTSQTGWYAYLYGYSYAVPRVYSHLIAENYQYAKENNVLTHHADFHPSLGDGPKPWLSAKLQWDTDQDVDELLNEWYERAVGQEAAPDLAAYYDLWEQFWMERAEDSGWFQNSKHDTYLGLGDFTYLSLVTEEDISESRQLLESVVAKANTEEQQTRADLMLRQFEYYEASALSYPKNLDPPENEEEALNMLENWSNSLEFRLQMIQKRYDLVEEFKDDLSLRYPGDPFRRGTWTGWNPDEFWHLDDYIKSHESNGGAVTDQVKKLTQQYDEPKVREFAQMLRGMESPTSLTENPSFEDGGEDANAWNFWKPDGTANIKRVEGIAHTGNSSVLFENAKKAGVYQILPIKPGILASQVHYYTPAGNETEGTIQIVIEASNDAGDKTVYRSDAAKLTDTTGEWASVGFLEDIPEKVEGQDTSEILLNVQINNAQDTQVYQDDIVVYQHAPSSVDIMDLVTHFAEDGEFETESAVRALTLHLTAIQRFEEQGAVAKVIKHMNGFYQLLDYQLVNELISEDAYQVLHDEAETRMKQFMTAHLNTGHIQASSSGDHPLSITFENKTTQDMDVTVESDFPEGISFDIDSPIEIGADQLFELEGSVQLSKDLADGDYEGTVTVNVNGNKMHELPLTISLNRNLIPNPGFEEDADGDPSKPKSWHLFGIGLAKRVQDEVYSEQYAITIPPDSDNNNNKVRSSSISVLPGIAYNMSGWAKSAYTEGSARIGIREIDSSGETIRYHWKSIDPNSDWKQYEIVFTPGNNTKNIQIYMDLMPNTNDSVWFDDFRMEMVEE